MLVACVKLITSLCRKLSGKDVVLHLGHVVHQDSLLYGVASIVHPCPDKEQEYDEGDLWPGRRKNAHHTHYGKANQPQQEQHLHATYPQQV